MRKRRFHVEKAYNALFSQLISGNSLQRRFQQRYLNDHDAMKLHSNNTQAYQTVTAYDDSSVEINAQSFHHSLIVMPEIAPIAWPVTSFDALAPEHLAQIDAAAPDVVILGTGRRQRFVHPKLISMLTVRRVGVESMDNQAACRTYNILMAEGRKVALALIIEPTSAGTIPA